MIRQAKLEDIDNIKKIAAKYTKELGFILKPALIEAVNRSELLYDPDSGAFCHYHRRKDRVTIIYEICVPKEARGKGIGRMMVEMLPLPVQLKCPIDNESNKFYEHLGFRLIDTVQGRKRKLNIWMLGNSLENKLF